MDYKEGDCCTVACEDKPLTLSDIAIALTEAHLAFCNFVHNPDSRRAFQQVEQKYDRFRTLLYRFSHEC
jgi:hypothetical protein